MTNTEMHPIPDLNIVDIQFCTDISFAPAWDDLPEEFQNYDRNKFCDIASKLFFDGGSLRGHGMKPKDGVDAGKANGALLALLGSFEPSHEHKIGAAGFLIDQWFEPFEMEHEDSHRKAKQ